MASVRKRTWTYKGVEKEAWVVAYTDMAGKRRLKTFTKKKAADAHRLKVETEIEQGVHVAEASTVTVGTAIQAFEKDIDRRHHQKEIAGTTAKGYRDKLRYIKVSPLVSTKVTVLTRDQIKTFIDGLRPEYSPRTANAASVMFFMLLRFCVKSKWIKRNVLTDDPIRLQAGEKRVAIPSIADIRTIEAAIHERGDRENILPHCNRMLIFYIGILGGLRPGEMCALKWDAVNFEAGLIYVRHSMSRYDGLKNPKTKAGFRSVPMTPQVRDALTYAAKFRRCYDQISPDWSASMRSDRLLKLLRSYDEDPCPEDLGGFVLFNKYGKPLIPDNINKLWNPMMERVGLCDAVTKKPAFTCYALRHGAASLYIAKGLPSLNLQRLMGHSRASFTLDVYGHLFPEDARTKEAARDISSDLFATRPRHDFVSV